MSQSGYLLICGIVFALVFIAHALRLVYGWSAVLGGWSVPTWVSWIALVVSGLLAYEGFRLSSR